MGTGAHFRRTPRERGVLASALRLLREGCAARREGRRIEEFAGEEPLAGPVALLSTLRGIAAATIAAETCDFTRFPDAGSYMAFTGLTPSEHSSGASRHQGSITKTGNRHVRRVLVEAAWAYRHAPAVRGKLKERLEGHSPDVAAYSWAAAESTGWRTPNPCEIAH